MKSPVRNQRKNHSSTEYRSTGYTDPAKVRLFGYFTHICAFLLLVIAFMVTLGWYLDIPRLQSFVLMFPAMRVSTAFAFVAGAMFLFLTQHDSSGKNLHRINLALRTLCALIIFSIGALRFYNFLTGNILELDTVLLHLPPPDMTGRVDLSIPNTPFFFCLLGIAMLFYDVKIRKLYYSQLLIVVAAIVSMPLVISYLYQINLVPGVSITAALPTLISYVFLIVGLLMARPTRQLMDIFTKDSAGGYLVRRLIIYAIVLPLLVGSLIMQGSRMGLYDADFRYLFAVTALILLFIILIWENARSLHNSDIERREAREELFETEKKFSALADSDIIGVIIADLQGTIYEANEGFSKLVNYSDVELTSGQVHWNSLTPEEHLPNDEVKMRELLRKGQVQPYEKEFSRKDGTLVPVIFGMTLLNKQQGIFIAFALDITERKRLEQRKDEFISIASHELKTPLTSIKGYTQILQRMIDKAASPAANNLLVKTNTYIDRLSGLIADLLDVSRIQSGKLVFNVGEFDVYELVRESVDSIQSTSETHAIILKHPIHQKIHGDKYRLEQVLHNLLTNAIKYSPKADKVHVRMDKTGDTVIIAVQDFGIGIPPKEQNKLFQRFYRVETSSKQFSGLGIGLYISSEIVRRHGGRIRVESTEGKGSMFIVELPVKNSSKDIT